MQPIMIATDDNYKRGILLSCHCLCSLQPQILSRHATPPPTRPVPVLDERILSQPAFNPGRGRSEGGPVITKSRQHLWPIESAAWTDLPMGIRGPIPSISLTRTDSTPCY